jgi:hypothetical protein
LGGTQHSNVKSQGENRRVRFLSRGRVNVANLVSAMVPTVVPSHFFFPYSEYPFFILFFISFFAFLLQLIFFFALSSFFVAGRRTISCPRTEHRERGIQESRNQRTLVLPTSLCRTFSRQKLNKRTSTADSGEFSNGFDTFAAVGPGGLFHCLVVCIISCPSIGLTTQK